MVTHSILFFKINKYSFFNKVNKYVPVVDFSIIGDYN